MIIDGGSGDPVAAFMLDEHFTVVSENGRAILAVKTSKVTWSQAKADFASWLMEGNKDVRENLTEAEWETLAEICELPKIHIEEFPKWREEHANSNTRSQAAGGDDSGRSPWKGLQSLYQRWRVLWLSLRFRPRRS